MSDDLISKLSEIRSEYNCFNQDEEPYYRALSEVISILSRRADGDTISRQAVISELNKYVDYSDDGEQEINADIVFITLKEFPSAERRGRWVFNIDDKGWSWDKPYMCDQCGEWVEKVFKFFPNCGAKMYSEEEWNHYRETEK